MAAIATSAVYVEEFVRGFEQNTSLLRNAVTTTANVDGLTATFLVALASRSAVTRGPNGLIPAQSDNLSQVTVTLKEMHDLVTKTNFYIDVGQADQRAIMQMTSMRVINREIDDAILAALASATVTVTAAVMDMTAVQKGLVKLGNAEVDFDGDLYGVITPAAMAELMNVTGFASSDFTRNRPLDNGLPSINQASMVEWMGIKWIMHPRLTGTGTSSATMYIFHKSAIGHAYAGGDRIKVALGYNDEQDYTYARHSVYHGAKIIQNSGIVKFTHDDSALS